MDKRCLAVEHNSDCTDGEPRTSIPSIPSLTIKWSFYFFPSFTGTVECADVVPKYVYIWDVEKTCFSKHTGGTTGAIFNMLYCESREPVLVEIRSKIIFSVRCLN